MDSDPPVVVYDACVLSNIFHRRNWPSTTSLRATLTLFLTSLYRENAEIVSAVVEAARANLRMSEPTIEEYMEALLDQGLRSFASIVGDGMRGKVREE